MSDMVPEGWTKAKFQDIAGLIKGLTYSTSDYTSKDSGHPFITLKCIQKNGGFSQRGLKYYSGKYKESQTVKSGDVVFANTDLTRDGDVVGSPLLVPSIPSDKPSLISMDLSKVVPKSGHNGGFIYYWLQTAEVKRQMINLSAGSTVLHLNTRDVPYLQLVAPPLPEQQKIATILSSVDDVIEKTRAQIDKLKDLKTGMMQELLTKGIGHTEFKDSPVGRIPDGWDVVPTGKIAKSIVPGRNKPKEFNGNIPWLTISDLDQLFVGASKLNYGVTREALAQASGKTLPANSVIMTVVGEFGISSIAEKEVVINQQLHGFVCGERISPVFLCLSLQLHKSQMEKLATQTTISYMNKENAESILLALPPLQEQEQIVAAITSIEKQYTLLSQKHSAQQKMKKALMQDLLTGKVRVNVEQKESVVA